MQLQGALDGLVQVYLHVVLAVQVADSLAVAGLCGCPEGHFPDRPGKLHLDKRNGSGRLLCRQVIEAFRGEKPKLA